MSETLPRISKLAWELLEQEGWWEVGGAGYTRRVARAKIPGGWLVRAQEDSRVIRAAGGQTGQPTTAMGVGEGRGVGLTFVPDPGHQWALPDG